MENVTGIQRLTEIQMENVTGIQRLTEIQRLTGIYWD
jgi:hypothetical protein